MSNKKNNIYNQDNKIIEGACELIKTNINFYNNQIKSLSILSCNPAEGKTTIAINIAINFAKDGKKVLLVDSNLRKSINFKNSSEEQKDGLSNILVDNLDFNSIKANTTIENLDYISSGTKVSNSAELLLSYEFEQFINDIKVQYDLVIFDTTSLSDAKDAVMVASKTDATVLVVKSSDIDYVKLQRVKYELEKSNINVLGVILNNVSKKEYKRYLTSYACVAYEAKASENERDVNLEGNKDDA
jgi:capsular exopolysaccharide synthesis family protein